MSGRESQGRNGRAVEWAGWGEVEWVGNLYEVVEAALEGGRVCRKNKNSKRERRGVGCREGSGGPGHCHEKALADLGGTNG